MREVYVHQTAIIEEGATLGQGVKVGPFCIVGKNVILHDNVELKSHVVVCGQTTVGEGTTIFPFASIGSAPQDLKYNNEDTSLVIGKNNVIREHVTINLGTISGNKNTIVGDKCLFMVGVHIAHDCIVGSNVIMANNATLGGHVIVEDHAIIGGLAAIHQFVRIGRHAMIGGTSGVKYDVPPFAMIIAQEPKNIGINVVGLRRHQFSREDLLCLKESYDIFLDENFTMAQSIQVLREKFNNNKAVSELILFLSEKSIRGVRKLETQYES